MRKDVVHQKLIRWMIVQNISDRVRTALLLRPPAGVYVQVHS